MTAKEFIDMTARWGNYPFEFIEFMWGLTPHANEGFIEGKHMSLQQAQLVRAAKAAVLDVDKKRIAVRAAHGVGKSTTVAWLVLWFLLCYREAQVACTAPSATQMHDVLWKEIFKWLNKMPKEWSELYEYQGEYVRMKMSPPTWFARAKTARREEPEALAGVHGKHVFIVADEASSVDDAIFQIMEGSLTEANYIVILISNPTRTEGYFFDAFHSDKDSWNKLHFSALESPLVKADYIERIAKDGLESREYRIQVLGDFLDIAGIDDKGYVPLVNEKDLRFTDDDNFVGTLRMGVDPAGAGKNFTTWVIRDSFKAKLVGKEAVSTPKSIAEKTLTLMKQYKVEAHNVYIDNFGAGSNVGMELMYSRNYVNAVNVGEKAEEEDKYMNKKAEIAWRVREWIMKGGMLVGTLDEWKPILKVKYKSELSGKLKVISKDELRRRGIESPDEYESLSLTFVENDSEYSTVENYGRQVTENFDPHAII